MRPHPCVPLKSQFLTATEAVFGLLIISPMERVAAAMAVVEDKEEDKEEEEEQKMEQQYQQEGVFPSTDSLFVM